MKVTRSQLQIAVLVLGGILILFGVVKLLFGVNLGSFVEQNLPTTVMIAAVGIFGWNRYLLAQEKKKRDEEEAELKAAGSAEGSSTANPIEAPTEIDPKL